MGRFEFRKRGIELDIAGVKVTLPGEVEYLKHLQEVCSRADFSVKEDGLDAVDSVTDEMLNILDELLGEEAMDAIEEKRKLDVCDCCDILEYITKEVAAYYEERTPKIKISVSAPQGTQPMAMGAVENRATRRARQREERRNK